jgi:hypothetical protein
MQYSNPANEIIGQCMRSEHNRLHSAEGWADSPYKEAVLASVRSALEGLERAAVPPFEPPQCMVCASRRRESRVLLFPSRSKGSPAITRLAA